LSRAKTDEADSVKDYTKSAKSSASLQKKPSL